tara:strand:+ start:5396 stop:6220 length:825 start_codon:yes stop_codon:yes gene_type:complete
LRIYPLYWISIFLSLILILCFGHEFSIEYQGSMYVPDDFYGAFRNLFLFFPFQENPRLTPPAWALTVEIFFYILIGLGVSKTLRLTVLWFILSILYHVFALLLDLGWSNRYFTIFAASLPFSAGALIFHFKNEIIKFTDGVSSWLYGWLPFIILMFFILNWYIGYLIGSQQGFFFYTNFLLCLLMISTLLGTKKLPFISRDMDKWIGDFSYPVYLFHYQVGILVVFFAGLVGFELHRPDSLLLVVSIPVILLFSWAVSVLFEQPIEKIRSRVKK